MQQSLLPQLPVPSPHEPQLTMSFDWIQKEKYVGDQTKKVVLGIVARGSDEMQQKISNMGRQLGEQVYVNLTVLIFNFHFSLSSFQPYKILLLRC